MDGGLVSWGQKLPRVRDGGGRIRMTKHGKLTAAVTALLWLAGCGGGGSTSTGGGGTAGTTADFSRMVAGATTSSTTGAVTGTVTDESGDPVAGATVTVTAGGRQGGGVSFSTQADGNGQFAIGNMTPGVYDLAALHEAAGEGTVQVQVQAGQVNQGARPQCRPQGARPGGGEFGGQGGPLVDAGVIVGLVQDAAGNPIARARLSINNRLHAGTGELGAFAFGPLPAGSYTVGCRAEGFIGSEQTAEVAAGQATELLFILEAGDDGTVDVASASLTGIVFDAATAAPIAGAAVVLSDGRATTTTADDGTFSFADLRPGGYRFGVVADGYRPVAFPIRLVPGAELALRVPVVVPSEAIAEVGTLVIHVVDAASAEGIGGAQVSIDDLRPFHADRAGRVELRHVPVGAHNLAAWGRGYGRALATATVSAGETTEVTIELSAAQNHGGNEQLGPPDGAPVTVG